jgi:hypothetical protein
MKRSLYPRLRTPVKMAVGGAAVLAVGGVMHGWETVLAVLPVVVVATVGYYLWAGRQSDVAAVIRHQTDERQAILRLKMQALVGRVMSGAAVLAYLVATASKMTLWPFVVLVCLPAASLFIGWLIYGEHGDRHANGAHTTHI